MLVVLPALGESMIKGCLKSIEANCSPRLAESLAGLVVEGFGVEASGVDDRGVLVSSLRVMDRDKAFSMRSSRSDRFFSDPTLGLEW